MFSINSNATPSPPVSAESRPTAQSAKRLGRSGTAPSIFGTDLTVTGMLNSTGEVQIDGILEGDVRSISLVIGEGAEIRGQVWVEDLTVRGRVIGRIHARKVLLAATSRVEGDVLYQMLAVEAGAIFEGNCQHSDHPLGDEGRQSQRVQSERPSSQAAGVAGLTAMKVI